MFRRINSKLEVNVLPRLIFLGDQFRNQAHDLQYLCEGPLRHLRLWKRSFRVLRCCAASAGLLVSHSLLQLTSDGRAHSVCALSILLA